MKHLKILIIISLIITQSSSKSIKSANRRIHSDIIIPTLNTRHSPTASSFYEYGKFFQGDIFLSDDQWNILTSKVPQNGRTGLLIENYRWPKAVDGFVYVPFKISRDYLPWQINLIHNAMKSFSIYTCIRFIERTYETDYIEIFSGNGCSSFLGRQGGRQMVSLHNKGCINKGIIAHELIHAVGYNHMHTHIDRDKFIEIKWENINKDFLYNFEKIDAALFDNFGTPYDFNSLMHYEPWAFSVNGKNTIETIDARYQNMIGQRIGMSVGDVTRINRMYKC